MSTSATFASILETRGGFHPRILSRDVDVFLDSPTFHKKLNTMKVGTAIRVHFELTRREAKALQERIWRVNEWKNKEFRTFTSKRTRHFFVFRLA